METNNKQTISSNSSLKIIHTPDSYQKTQSTHQVNNRRSRQKAKKQNATLTATNNGNNQPPAQNGETMQSVNLSVSYQKNIQHIGVSESDWKELKSFIDKIVLPKQGLDWLSLVYGAIASLAISLGYSLYKIKDNDYSDVLFYGGAIIFSFLIVSVIHFLKQKTVSQLNEDQIHLNNAKEKMNAIERKVEKKADLQ